MNSDPLFDDEDDNEKAYNLIRDNLKVQAYRSRHIDKKALKLTRILAVLSTAILTLLGYLLEFSKVGSGETILNSYIVVGIVFLIVTTFYSISAYTSTTVIQFPSVEDGDYTYKNFGSKDAIKDSYRKFYQSAQEWIRDNRDYIETDQTFLFNSQAYLLTTILSFAVGIMLVFLSQALNPNYSIILSTSDFISSLNISDLSYYIDFAWNIASEDIYSGEAELVEKGVRFVISSIFLIISSIFLIFISPIFIFLGVPLVLEIFVLYGFKSGYHNYLYLEDTDSPDDIRKRDFAYGFIKTVALPIYIVPLILYALVRKSINIIGY